jgi:HK97 family phage major capsid protein
LTSFIDISKQFLQQDSNDAEAILINDLAQAIAEKLDKTVFGSGSGSTTQPAGLFSGAYVQSGATAITGVSYDNVLDLESKVEEKNGTDFIFIANPKVKYALKGTQMASGLEMVYSKGEIDGYKAIVSNSVENKGILCMDPRDLAVATWSGVEITVDTVTRAIYNEVRIVVNYLVDAKLRGDRISGEIFS